MMAKHSTTDLIIQQFIAKIKSSTHRANEIWQAGQWTLYAFFKNCMHCDLTPKHHSEAFSAYRYIDELYSPKV